MYKEVILPFLNYTKSNFSHLTGIKTIVKTKFLTEKKFYCSSSVEAYRTLRHGGEESALGAFLFLLKDDDTLWDIGSSIGLFSIFAADNVKQIHSFEPDPQIHKRCNENVTLNNLQNKITCHQIGIGEKPGEMQLNSDGIKGFSPSLSNLSRHSKTIDVKINSVDQLISEGLESPSVIKIDIEGAEILALRGAQSLLKSDNKPRLLFIELHPEFLTQFSSSTEEVLELLKSCSYQVLSSQKRDDQFHIIAIPQND